jgi:pimeloyl-ACP methyl ester carboxylesterase
MATDSFQRFLEASVEKRIDLVLASDHEPALRARLGDAAFEEYRDLARRTKDAMSKKHLGPKTAKNLIFVPGIMGSLLHSQYYAGVWWIDLRALGSLNKLRLAPNGMEDAEPSFDVAAFNVDQTYDPFLFAAMVRDDVGLVRFPYDWRKPIAHSSDAFRDLVNHTWASNGQKPVHVVAHSMGGLVIRAALMAHGDEIWPKIGKTVFVGTPHYGSPAIAGYLKNHFWGFELLALLGKYMNRATFRSLWGALELLPAPLGIYPGTRASDIDPRSWGAGDPYNHPCANFDLYQAESWKLGLTGVETAHLQAALDNAAAFHKRLYQWHQGLSIHRKRQMLVIAGVGQKTLFRLEQRDFLHGGWDRIRKVTDRTANDVHREGDGRVPVASAALENVPIRYVRGVHGELASIPRAYEDVFRWMKDEPLELASSMAQALSTHLGASAADSYRPVAPHVVGTDRADPRMGDPGYWNLEDPDPARLTELEVLLEAGQLPQLATVRLL